MKGEAEGLAERAVFAGKRNPVRFLIHSARFRPADGVFSGGQATAGHIIQYPIADQNGETPVFFIFSGKIPSALPFVFPRDAGMNTNVLRYLPIYVIIFAGI